MTEQEFEDMRNWITGQLLITFGADSDWIDSIIDEIDTMSYEEYNGRQS